ncbi:MAG: hypothetical protein ACRCXD_10875 [Luteolibacter sp.]
MQEILIILGVATFGSLFWLVIQTGAWTLALKNGIPFRRLKMLLIAALIGFPAFVGFVGLLRATMPSQTPLWDFLIAPGLIAYVIGLSMIALFLARYLVKPHRAESPPEDFPNKSRVATGDNVPR